MLRHLFFICQDHAAFAGGEGLAHLKAEAAAVANSASADALPLGAVRMRAVGDDGYIVPGGDVPQHVHVARHAAVVHGHYGPRL